MADLDLTKKPKIYHTLYLLNSAFAGIVEHIQTLHNNGVFRRHSTRLHQSFAQELQAQINDETFEILASVELNDVARYGKARDVWEKSLQGPNEIFLRAAERRRELAEQRKKPKKR